jgi:parvulin-like peptidyl-prolyl isomerase
MHHILFLSNSSTPDEKNIIAQRKAEDVLQRIKNGEDFAELAKLYSEDGTASSGGDLGFFPRGKMIKAFEEVAFKLEVGAVSSVLKTEFGYHILKCEGIKPPKIAELKEAEPKIREKLFSEKAEIRKKALIEKLKKDSIVELHL